VGINLLLLVLDALGKNHGISSIIRIVPITTQEMLLPELLPIIIV
jgi:hypothetical protein